MIILVILIVLVVLVYARFRQQRKRMYELAAKVPSMSTLPLIGSAHLFIGDAENTQKLIEEVTHQALRHNGIIKAWIGPFLYFGIVKSKDVEAITTSYLEKDDNSYKFMRSWIGNGLITAPVSIWKRQRKLIMPAFSQHILDNFIEVYNEQTATMVEKLRARVGQGEFDFFDYISPCMLDIVCETTMGVKTNAQADSNNPYFQASWSQQDIIYKRMFQIWLKPQFLFNLTKHRRQEQKNLKIISSFIDGVLRRKRQAFKDEMEARVKSVTEKSELSGQKPKRKAFLDMLLEMSEQGNHFTDQELRDEVGTMTIAGNDTTALTIAFALVMLGSHPQEQEKVYQEIKEIFGDSKEAVTKDDLTKMKYLERVIKETLRMFPTVPLFVRRLDKEVELEKYTLPEGSCAVIALWGMHRDKVVWGADANSFIPDRFLPEHLNESQKESFMPFSHGVRGCIGRQLAMMSMKTILSTLLRTFKFSASGDFDLQASLVLKPTNGHLLSVTDRYEHM